MDMLEKAIIISVKAHSGQVDKGDEKYIFHPIRVMMNAISIDEKIIAILHDVVEDSGITIENLKNEGFSENILSAIDCLTRRKKESYEDFINRISKNKLATNVKILDILDNLNTSRLKTISDIDKERLNKYREALKFLIYIGNLNN